MTDCSKVTTYSSWLAIEITKDFNVVMLETIDKSDFEWQPLPKIMIA
jgi:hypothetical protein